MGFSKRVEEVVHYRLAGVDYHLYESNISFF
jgi:hypothetical protein